MTLLAIEGFDHYDNSTKEGKRTWSGGAIATGNGRYPGGNCWEPSNGITAYIEFVLAGNYQELIVGAAVFLTGASSTQTTLFSFRSLDDVVQGELHIGAGNVLYYTRGTSTILVTGTTPLGTDQWHYIECRLKIDNAVGEIEVHIAGLSEFSLSGQDTQISASYASANVVRMYGFRHVADGRLDDVYILETGSSPNDAFLGDCRVDTLLVNADGTTNQWTPSGAATNYEAVDEAPPDDAATYIESTLAGDVDLFAHVDLAQLTNVYGVQIVSRMAASEIGEGWARLGVRVGGVNYWGDVVTANLSWAFVLQIFDQNPNTLTAWTRTTVNAAEVGVERITQPPTTPAPTTAPPTTLAPTTASPTTLSPTTL